MFPKPPRPVENLWPAAMWEGWEDEGSVRRVLALRVEGGGGRVLLPAPPRPKVILVAAVGCGSVKQTGITGGMLTK